MRVSQCCLCCRVHHDERDSLRGASHCAPPMSLDRGFSSQAPQMRWSWSNRWALDLKGTSKGDAEEKVTSFVGGNRNHNHRNLDRNRNRNRNRNVNRNLISFAIAISIAVPIAISTSISITIPAVAGCHLPCRACLCLLVP